MISKEEMTQWHCAMSILFRISEAHNWRVTEGFLFKVNERFYKKLASKAKGKTIDTIIAEMDDDSGEEENEPETN